VGSDPNYSRSDTVVSKLTLLEEEIDTSLGPLHLSVAFSKFSFTTKCDLQGCEFTIKTVESDAPFVIDHENLA
jgi:hypothetical protein